MTELSKPRVPVVEMTDHEPDANSAMGIACGVKMDSKSICEASCSYNRAVYRTTTPLPSLFMS